MSPSTSPRSVSRLLAVEDRARILRTHKLGFPEAKLPALFTINGSSVYPIICRTACSDWKPITAKHEGNLVNITLKRLSKFLCAIKKMVHESILIRSAKNTKEIWITASATWFKLALTEQHRKRIWTLPGNLNLAAHSFGGRFLMMNPCSAMSLESSQKVNFWKKFLIRLVFPVQKSRIPHFSFGSEYNMEYLIVGLPSKLRRTARNSSLW